MATRQGQNGRHGNCAEASKGDAPKAAMVGAIIKRDDHFTQDKAVNCFS